MLGLITSTSLAKLNTEENFCSRGSVRVEEKKAFYMTQ